MAYTHTLLSKPKKLFVTIGRHNYLVQRLRWETGCSSIFVSIFLDGIWQGITAMEWPRGLDDEVIFDQAERAVRAFDDEHGKAIAPGTLH